MHKKGNARLRELAPGGQREPVGGIHATYQTLLFLQVCTEMDKFEGSDGFALFATYEKWATEASLGLNKV